MGNNQSHAHFKEINIPCSAPQVFGMKPRKYFRIWSNVIVLGHLPQLFKTNIYPLEIPGFFLEVIVCPRSPELITNLTELYHTRCHVAQNGNPTALASHHPLSVFSQIASLMQGCQMSRPGCHICYVMDQSWSKADFIKLKHNANNQMPLLFNDGLKIFVQEFLFPNFIMRIVFFFFFFRAIYH